jgi:hypothetical protein
VHRNESQFPLAVRQGASAGEHKRKGNGAIGMAPRCDAPNPLYVSLPHAKTEPVEVSVKASWYPAPTAVTLVPEADQPGRGPDWLRSSDAAAESGATVLAHQPAWGWPVWTRSSGGRWGIPQGMVSSAFVAVARPA